AQWARRMGFIGKSCIHPSQVALANDTFQPIAQEIALAKRIVDAADRAREQGQGVCVVDGKMIDAHFVERAYAILAEPASDTRQGRGKSSRPPHLITGEHDRHYHE